MMSVLKYISLVFCDRLIFFFSLFDSVDEFRRYRNSNEYCIKFLQQFDYKVRYREKWEVLFGEMNIIRFENVKRIYSLNNTYDFLWVRNKMNYYVEHRLWSLLNFFEIDTFYWQNEEVFGAEGLNIYYIIATNEEKYIVFCSIWEGNLKYIKHFKSVKVPLAKMRNRQVLYDKKGEICTL